MGRSYKIPEKEIRFAAKSGFLTRRLWDEFFNFRTQSSSSRRWRSFKSRGIFVNHSSSLLRNCLILNKRSLDVQKIFSGKISSPPPVVQLYHDELVARIILKLNSRGIIHNDYYLEPELRRMYQENGMSPEKATHLKLPDALFEIKSGEETSKVALEVELSKKRQSRYKKTIESYSSNKKIDRVVIVHQGKLIKSSYERLMLKHDYPYQSKPIFFIEVDEVFKKDSYLFRILNK